MIQATPGEAGVLPMPDGSVSGRTNALSLEIFNAVSAGEFDRAVVLCGLPACLSLLLYAAIARCQRRED